VPSSDPHMTGGARVFDEYVWSKVWLQRFG
jgi:hypothetical protein